MSFKIDSLRLDTHQREFFFFFSCLCFHFILEPIQLISPQCSLSDQLIQFRIFFVVFTQLFNFLQLSMNQRQQYNIRLLRRVYTCGLRMRFWPINQSTSLALFVCSTQMHKTHVQTVCANWTWTKIEIDDINAIVWKH